MASAPIRDQAGGVPIGWVSLECELNATGTGWRRPQIVEIVLTEGLLKE